MEANIVNECRRRRFFETQQDIVKRKQKDAARQRKRFSTALSATPVTYTRVPPPACALSSRVTRAAASKAAARDMQCLTSAPLVLSVCSPPFLPFTGVPPPARVPFFTRDPAAASKAAATSNDDDDDFWDAKVEL
ncbi:unnamed protein product [Closterium sp. NIES-65]|nr:unnamed protein product [Closterium sp. NIES-65]